MTRLAQLRILISLFAHSAAVRDWEGNARCRHRLASAIAAVQEGTGSLSD
jgi:hypothetical protein